MVDLRVETPAKLLTRYALRLKKGDVLVPAGHAACAEAIRACYRAAIRCGAHVEPRSSIAVAGAARGPSQCDAGPGRRCAMRRRGGARD